MNLSKKLPELKDDDPLHYELRLSDQLFYNQRYQYLTLIKNYLRQKITAFDFVSEFRTLYQEEASQRNKLSKKQITINSNSQGFSSIICDIFSYCDYYELEFDAVSQNYYMVDEKKFEALIQFSFLEIQDYIDHEYQLSGYDNQRILSFAILFSTFVTIVILLKSYPDIIPLKNSLF